MRSEITLFALGTAIAVTAQNSVINDYGNRYFFWLNNPTACGSGGCVGAPCGSGQCQFGVTCGTWAGVKDSCCEARHGAENLDCTPWKDVLEDFDFDTSGSAVARLQNNEYCANDQNFILTDPNPNARDNICCPQGMDAVVWINWPKTLNNITLEGVRCIPAVEGSSASGSGSGSSPSSSGGSTSPTSTNSGSSGSSTPNAASRLQNVLAIIPAAFMVLAAF
ncbi:hypothetical protein ABW20_dc0104765 [Dactylellina cionopaga]|nr:hypothetical protein ABW20_dc0104765 [Dactylellina cionopaga]